MKATRVVKIGTLPVGGKYPVRIKGMIKSPFSNHDNVIAETRQLEREGAEAIRIAIKEEKDAAFVRTLKRHTKVPLVADIHFHYRFALAAIANGFDAIRLNPLNIAKASEVREVVREAKKAHIAIRIGINSGGFKKDFVSSHALAKQMVKVVADYIRILEREHFYDIMVSLKGSDPLSTIVANELFAKDFEYPLHLGVTATGSFLSGVVKSSIGLGQLLSKGIGSVIRVSLTAPSYTEIQTAKYILQALHLRTFGPQIISCPTCSRCEVNLIRMVQKLQEKLKEVPNAKPIRIALMGCVVNGPGEARQADIGAAFGKRKAVIFRKDKIVGHSDAKNILNDLCKEARKLWI